MTTSMLAGLVLAFAIDPPTVTVDVDALTLPQAHAEQLHGELMTRLVEQGHAVGSSGAIVVRLTGGGDRVHIEVQHGTQASTRDVHGKGALLRLATIHAAIELLAELPAVADPDPVRAAARERSVVVVADAQAQSWLPTLIEALVDAGNVVTPRAESASMRVCLSALDERPTLAAVPVDHECPAGAASEDLANDAGAVLSAARADASARAQRSETPDGPASIADSVASPSDATTATPNISSRTAAAKMPPVRNWAGVVGLGVGAQGRLSAAEALVLVHGDARHRSGAMLTLRASVAPTVDASLRAADTFVTAGAGWGTQLHARVRFELAAAIGIAVHGFRLGNDRGTRADITAELPVTFAFVLAPRVELGLSVLAGVSGRKRRHLIDGDVEWSRDQWRIAGVASIRVVLGRKLARAKMAEEK